MGPQAPTGGGGGGGGGETAPPRLPRALQLDRQHILGSNLELRDVQELLRRLRVQVIRTCPLPLRQRTYTRTHTRTHTHTHTHTRVRSHPRRVVRDAELRVVVPIDRVQLLVAAVHGTHDLVEGPAPQRLLAPLKVRAQARRRTHDVRAVTHLHAQRAEYQPVRKHRRERAEVPAR